MDLKLDEGFGELSFEAEGHSEGVCFELVVSGEDVHKEFHHRVHWGEGVGEEDEADDDRANIVETEGGIQRGVVDKDAEEREDIEGVELDAVSMETD